MYRILSLDGGGIRGVYTLMVLKRLEEEAPGFLERVDLVAGTSVGGIIAMGIAAGVGLDRLISLFSENGPAIFPKQRFAGKLKRSALREPRYSNDGLVESLRLNFGDSKLSDLKKSVMVASFDLDNKGEKGRIRTWGPKFFHNLSAATGDLEVPCWKVGLYTSAAPTYFPSVDGFVDGGIAANNPSMCALALASKHLAEKGNEEGICVLSIGTGRRGRYIDKDTAGWGIVEWSSYLLPLLMDAPSGIAEYQCSAILGDNWHRIDSVIEGDEPMGLDELEGVPRLIKTAQDTDIVPAIQWLRRKWA